MIRHNHLLSGNGMTPFLVAAALRNLYEAVSLKYFDDLSGS